MAIFIMFVESWFLLDGLMPSLNSKAELNLVTFSSATVKAQKRGVGKGQCALMWFQTSGEMAGIINFIFDESQVDHKAHKPLNSLEINNGFRLRCTFCLRVCVH